MFGLETKHLEQIKAILTNNLDINNSQIYIFGSRAKDTYKTYSDIDIAINYNNQQLSIDILAKILTDFEDSLLPYKVDVIDLNSIDDNFKKLITPSLKPLYSE